MAPGAMVAATVWYVPSGTPSIMNQPSASVVAASPVPWTATSAPWTGIGRSYWYGGQPPHWAPLGACEPAGACAVFGGTAPPGGGGAGGSSLPGSTSPRSAGWPGGTAPDGASDA